MAEAYENLAGRVEEIVYRNPDNGYTVLQLNTGEANGDGETVAGEMPPISEGGGGGVPRSVDHAPSLWPPI